MYVRKTFYSSIGSVLQLTHISEARCGSTLRFDCEAGHKVVDLSGRAIFGWPLDARVQFAGHMATSTLSTGPIQTVTLAFHLKGMTLCQSWLDGSSKPISEATAAKASRIWLDGRSLSWQCSNEPGEEATSRPLARDSTRVHVVRRRSNRSRYARRDRVPRMPSFDQVPQPPHASLAPTLGSS